MPLTSGMRIGPYEIVGPLGAGGMGEVYRARDTRLRREVALKVLPADVATDAGRRARFEQEAHAAAALNHPNILGVHDVGSDAGVFYIATELVSGQTLSALLEQGPVPIRTLLDIAVQIADGLAAAHTAQIVHRDLKPANVMIASDGRVKILDFGLAKQTARVSAGDETILLDRTEPGMIVGTVSYMSPEQARGKPTDYRSDQFSFGLVLYELVTGKKAFDKAESVQTMSAIIAEEPTPIEARVPPPLRWVIDRCLAKEPAGRYESTRDLFQELRSLRDHLTEVSTQVEAVADIPVPAPRRRIRWALPLAFVLGVAGTVAAIIATRGAPLPDQSSYRFTPFSFEPGGQAAAVWSPDGKAVAYAARQTSSSPFQVYIRYLDAATPVQLTRATTSAYPIGWSPDSKRILLTMAGPGPAIWSLATVGGEPERFMALPADVAGGDTAKVTVSPDNKTVAMLVVGEKEPAHILISSPPGSPPTRYSPAPFAARDVYNTPRIRFSPDGKRILLLINRGERGEEAWLLDYPPGGSNAAREVLQGLQSYSGTPTVGWMPDSRHVVLSVQATRDGATQLWLADLETGERHALTSGTTASSSPAVHPDGRKLILSETSGNYDVVSVDLATATARTVISTARNELMPSSAVTEPAMVYVSDRNGSNEIWLRRAGIGDRPIVTARDFPGGTQWFMAPALAPQADRVIYGRVESEGTARLWISAVAGGTPIQLTNDTRAEFGGDWSPDGAWFVYYVLRDEKLSLMKAKTSGQATPAQIAAQASGSTLPSWSPTGEWIVHGSDLVSPDGKTTRPIGDHKSPHYTFSRDGRLLYGLRQDKDQQFLFSIDVATGAEKVIGDVGAAFVPGSNLNPSIRFSLLPDGKSFVYGSGSFTNNLWMLEGFAEPKGWLSRLIR